MKVAILMVNVYLTGYVSLIVGILFVLLTFGPNLLNLKVRSNFLKIILLIIGLFLIINGLGLVVIKWI